MRVSSTHVCCMYVHMTADATDARRGRQISPPPKLKLQAVVSCLTLVLETDLVLGESSTHS